MKVKAKRPFKDKKTGELHDVNSIFEVTAARYKEIKTYVAVVSSVDEEKKDKKETKETKK